jgi:hypothetical protein
MRAAKASGNSTGWRLARGRWGAQDALAIPMMLPLERNACALYKPWATMCRIAEEKAPQLRIAAS